MSRIISRTLTFSLRLRTKPSAMTDPYPIPLQHPLSTPQNDPTSYQPHPLDGPYKKVPRPSEHDTDKMRARLVYQTRKRGTLETGLLISTFANPKRLEQMSRDQLEELDRLLCIPEWTLYYWGIGKQDPPEDSEWRHSPLLQDFKKHCKNEERSTRTMPELI